MFGDATAPAGVAVGEIDAAEISPQEAASLRQQADTLAYMLQDSAKAAEAMANDSNLPPEVRDEMRQRAQMMGGQAASLGAMNVATLRTQLPVIAAGSVALMNLSKAERNQAISEQVEEGALDASMAAAVAEYNRADNFAMRSMYDQQSLRDYLMASGEYTTSTETYYNSTTEAQFRSYEEQMRAQIAAATGDRKTVLENELKTMEQMKWDQLNDEALKGYEAWKAGNPERSAKMDALYEAGKLPERSDVPDPKLRESLAIIDANKFMEAAENNPLLKKAMEGKELTEAEKAQLSDEQKRALEWIETTGKNLTDQEKADIREAAKGIEAATTQEREKNKEKFPKLQEEVAKIREEGLKAGKSPEEIQKEIDEKVEAYCKENGFTKTREEIALRVKEEETKKGQQQGSQDQQQEPHEQKQLDGRTQDSVAPGSQHATVAGPTSESANAEGAGEVKEIKASASSVTTVENSKEYNRQDFAQLFAGNNELSGLLASIGVSGGQTMTNDNIGQFSAVSVQNPQYVAQMHEALNEEQSRA